MAEKELFEGLPEMVPAAVERSGGRPRMREPERRQVELRAVDLDGLLAMDHAARVIWRYVEQLDLSVLEDAIEAREHTAGQAPASPRLLLALWLYATSQGVGSARALERLCTSHDAYRWLCGGVSVNYHGLADFRSGHGELLDRLLTHNIATLSAAGVIELAEVVQDGVRVRASAGAASFRRGKSLHKYLKKARRLVEHLKRELDEDPDASNRRINAAKERATREREQRVTAALGKLAEIEAERERRAKTNKKQVAKQKGPRVSTTDPQARVMKMPDGGFRPAYNCQIGTVGEGQFVVDVGVDTTGSDRGQLRPMLKRLRAALSARAAAAAGRRRLPQERRHRVGGRRGCPRLRTGHPEQAQQRPLCAACQRPARRGRLAAAHEEPPWQRRLQATLHARMHQRSLPTVGPAPVHRPRRSQGKSRAALVRSGKQHPGRTSPHGRQRMTTQPQPPSMAAPCRCAQQPTAPAAILPTKTSLEARQQTRPPAQYAHKFSG